MKTIYKIIGYLTYTLCFLLILFNIDRLWLKIILSVVMLIIGWIAWELEHAKQMPEEFDMDLKDYAQYLKDKE